MWSLTAYQDYLLMVTINAISEEEKQADVGEEEDTDFSEEELENPQEVVRPKARMPRSLYNFFEEEEMDFGVVNP